MKLYTFARGVFGLGSASRRFGGSISRLISLSLSVLGAGQCTLDEAVANSSEQSHFKHAGVFKGINLHV